MCDGKFYGIAFIDNSIGERGVAYSVAVKRNGEYYHLESNRPVLEYVGDEIINAVEISLEAKRKPLPDGTLELTESELREFNKLFYHNTKCLKISASGVFILSNAEKNIINNYKAILWLAERFELTSNS